MQGRQMDALRIEMKLTTLYTIRDGLNDQFFCLRVLLLVI